MAARGLPQVFPTEMLFIPVAHQDSVNLYQERKEDDRCGSNIWTPFQIFFGMMLVGAYTVRLWVSKHAEPSKLDLYLDC